MNHELIQHEISHTVFVVSGRDALSAVEIRVRIISQHSKQGMFIECNEVDRIHF